MQKTKRQPFWKRERWIYAGAAFLIGVIETAAAMALGVEFTLGEHDVSLLVGGYIEVSFAAFGFLVGLLTEMRRAERFSAESARQTAAQLEAIRARLAQTEKLASLGQLAGTLAHEVRNPLAIIRSSVQNLSEALDSGDRENRQACHFVLEEIDRLSHVISSLVGFARPLKLECSVIRTASLVERTGLLAAPMLRDYSVELRVSDDGDPGEVEADPDLLCQALLGLLANAAEASPPNGVVELQSQRLGDGIELSVSDHGPGVPADLRDKIFEPFFTTRKDGSGLGLAVAKQIVEAHGGTLAVGDNGRGGARFSVRLQARRLAA